MRMNFYFKLLDNGVLPTLIINEPDAAGCSVWDSASAMGCRLVVIRIAAYRDRFCNSNYVCLVASTHFLQP